jgi:glutamyl-tRNA reductase
MSESSLLVVGVSHRRAAVGLRERVAIPKADLPESLRTLRSSPTIQECIIVSTCNRTEVYAVVDGGSGSADGLPLEHFLAERAGMDPEDLRPLLYRLSDVLVAQHLFRVASGLDSLVVGEVEILGQVKDALRAAEAARTGGKWLYTLFRRALEAGKRARSETAISTGATSVSWAAVELARERVPNLAQSQVLVLGAGATAEAVARALAARGVEGTMVANRTAERAETLARTVGGVAVPFAQLLSFLAIADVVICSTDAPHPILSRSSVQSTLAGRQGRRLYLIDLAVPRDIEPDVATLEGVELFDMDALAARASLGLRRREAEVAKVDQIILDEVDRFVAWQSSLRVTSTIASLQQRAEALRREELRRVSARLSSLSPEAREAIDLATRAIVNKMLHHPISVLRETAMQGTDERYVQAIEQLFDLGTTPGEPATISPARATAAGSPRRSDPVP